MGFPLQPTPAAHQLSEDGLGTALPWGLGLASPKRPALRSACSVVNTTNHTETRICPHHLGPRWASSGETIPEVLSLYLTCKALLNLFPSLPCRVGISPVLSVLSMKIYALG